MSKRTHAQKPKQKPKRHPRRRREPRRRNPVTEQILQSAAAQEFARTLLHRLFGPLLQVTAPLLPPAAQREISELERLYALEANSPTTPKGEKSN